MNKRIQVYEAIVTDKEFGRENAESVEAVMNIAEGLEIDINYRDAERIQESAKRFFVLDDEGCMDSYAESRECIDPLL